ncbi:hypothetical protein [Virgibacillus halodenitrificans]|nr:hypothetical protein [Virgibacillus halodenitrificans]MEC2160882.1 hypothetical protein [Virgibacillus halodenitrificans]
MMNILLVMQKEAGTKEISYIENPNRFVLLMNPGSDFFTTY